MMSIKSGKSINIQDMDAEQDIDIDFDDAASMTASKRSKKVKYDQKGNAIITQEPKVV